MAETNGNPTPDRLAELERENERLAAEVARVSQEKHALWQTLRVIAPGYVLTEAEMAAAMADPVPFSDIVAEAERITGVTHVP
jgi:hypothetical protein